MPNPAPRAVNTPAPQAEATRAPPNAIAATITLADIGYESGFRFANLGGRRELFVPLPQGADIVANELILVIDDVSAHDARRSLEILLNDRSVAAIALDGKSSARTVRIPLGQVKPRDGFLKLSFLYSGAATPDRCIDVRYVGDSLTVRPDTAVAIDIEFQGDPDVATTAALMPRDVTVALPQRRLAPSDIAAALTVARSLAALGRRVHFHHGVEALADLARGDGERAWTHGLIVVAALHEVVGQLDGPVATLAGPAPSFGALTAVRIAGLPALIVSEASAVHASRLLGSPTLKAARGVTAASVGTMAVPKRQTTQVNFDRLGVVLPQAEVFGRAELPVTIDTRTLPAGSKPSRLMLDVMVAPDGAGEKAVISVFVNERLVDSAVATTSELTRLDFPLASGLLGTVATVRVVVQRRSAQGDCRFEPQGYPAQILGSSTVVLEDAPAQAQDFSDLVAHWTDAVEVLLPASAAERPLSVLDLVANAANALASDSVNFSVQYVLPGAAPVPTSAFIAVSDVAPAGSDPRVRFDRGRVAVSNRAGQTLLDLGGFSNGAVAQVINAGSQPGLWIKPLAADGTLPSPAQLRLDRGDVAFVDRTGVALALSTERDTLVRMTYPDQVSWATVADRFRTWIIGTLWLLASLAFLYALQRMLRRRPRASE